MRHEWSMEHTKALRGWSILAVILAHAGDRFGIQAIQWVAGVGVSIFLILSGYGLKSSYEHNGLRHFWLKRICKIYVPYTAVFIIGEFVFGGISLGKILRIVTLNAHWYIKYLFIWYLIFYLVMLSSKKIRNAKPIYVALLVFGCIWLVLDSVVFINVDCPFLRARQMFAFPFGVMLADDREKILEKLTKWNWNIPMIFGGMAILLLSYADAVKNLPLIVTNSISLFTVLPIAIGGIGITQRFPKAFIIKPVVWIGMISFELFLVQEFSLRILASKSLMATIACLLVTVGGGVVFYYTNRLLRKSCKFV